MHGNNLKWLADLKRVHPYSFCGARVLELGSRDICGTIRPFFEDCVYFGVDIQPGPRVDIICDAELTKFEPECFDVIAAFSLFEHAPGWKEIVAHNYQWLRPGGKMFACFGAEGNVPHCEDGPGGWLMVPHEEFLRHAEAVGYRILDAFFEEDRYGPDCAGAYDVALLKDV